MAIGLRAGQPGDRGQPGDHARGRKIALQQCFQQCVACLDRV
jgi:hypothetical protein